MVRFSINEKNITKLLALFSYILYSVENFHNIQNYEGKKKKNCSMPLPCEPIENLVLKKYIRIFFFF